MSKQHCLLAGVYQHIKSSDDLQRILLYMYHHNEKLCANDLSGIFDMDLFKINGYLMSLYNSKVIDRERNKKYYYFISKDKMETIGDVLCRLKLL